MSSKNNSIGFIGAIGGTMAMILSWAKNASIIYIILHGFLGGLYVIYYAIVH